MTKYKFASLRLSSDSVVSSETMRLSSSGVKTALFSTMKSVELVIFRKMTFPPNHTRKEKSPIQLQRFQTKLKGEPMKQRERKKLESREEEERGTLDSRRVTMNVFLLDSRLYPSIWSVMSAKRSQLFSIFLHLLS